MRNHDHHRAEAGRFEDFAHATAALVCMEKTYVPQTRFVPPPLPTTSADATSKSREAIKMIVSEIVVHVVEPLLVVDSTDKFWSELTERYPRFRELLSSWQTLTTIELSIDRTLSLAHRSAEKELLQLVRLAKKFGGPRAAAEIDFASRTYTSAISIVRKLEEAGAPRDPQRDQRLIQEFQVWSKLHHLGAAMIIALSKGAERTDVGARQAFELHRAGALRAYCAVREAEELRQPETGDLEPADDWDGEDEMLALAE